MTTRIEDDKMTKNSKAEIINKYALSEKIKKGELLRLIRAAAPQGLAQKTSSGDGRARAERDLLRQYFISRVPQSCGTAVWKVF